MTQQSHFWVNIQRKGQHYLEDTATFHVFAAFFTIAQVKKQFKHPLTDEQSKNVTYVYSGILFSLKKKEIVSFVAQ